MADDKTVILQTHKYSFAEGELTIDRVCEITGAPMQIVQKIVEEEIVNPITNGSGQLFEAEALEAIERCLRLHNDLGVNWSGIAIIEQLLHKLHDLQHQLGLAAYQTGDVKDIEL